MNLPLDQHGASLTFSASGSSVALHVIGIVLVGSDIEMGPMNATLVAAHDMADNESFGNGTVVLDPNQSGHEMLGLSNGENRSVGSSAVGTGPFDAAMRASGLGTVERDPLGECGTAFEIPTRLVEVDGAGWSCVSEGASVGGAFSGTEDLIEPFEANVSIVFGGNAFKGSATGITGQSDHGIASRSGIGCTFLRAKELGFTFPKRFGVFAGSAKERGLAVSTYEVGHA